MIKSVKESAEHHFLAFLESLRDSTSGWIAIYFSMSAHIKHEKILERIGDLDRLLKNTRSRSEAFFDELCAHADGMSEAAAYLFSDNDIVFFARPADKAEKAKLKKLFEAKGNKSECSISDYTDFASQAYRYQKFADKKFLTEKRCRAYRTMADEGRVKSISLRRDRRDYPLVLIVEDDRFTASYTAGILNKDYEIVQARTGEEAITAYIEHAPDIVFLDIHLPGLSGHETLEAIKAVDPKAFAVMLSVDTVSANIKKAAGFGAHGFLKKPFSRDRLLDTVRKSPYIQASRYRAASSSDSVH